MESTVRNGWLSRRRIWVLGLLATSTLVLGLIAPLVWARPQKGPTNERHISFLVAHLMDQDHLSNLQVNDETSKRAFEKFVESLDAMKLFFLQSDIDEFAREQYRIDDYVKRGDLQLARRIFDRFLQRVRERIAVAQQAVDIEHDYTLDETMVRDPEKMAYAKSVAEADERWRKRVKYDLLVQLADDVSKEEAIEKLHKRYRSIRRNWEQTDGDELMELFLSALTMSFDPHSSYMSPSTLENFTIQMRLELNGIGASLQSQYGETIVKRLVPGGAADKDGRLKIDDVITGVAQGSSDDFTDIVEMKINDVVQLIRGKPGTIVRLEVMPADKSGRKIYDITRARIELKDSEARSEIIERGPDGAAVDEATGQVVQQQVGDGTVKKIGVISLPSFYMDMEGRRRGDPNFKSTSRDVRRLLEDFNAQGVDLVIMDLRFNGGGSLPESVQTTGLFIDQGPVVQVKAPNGLVQPYPDDEAGMVWSGPLVVLINKFSASASEIFAGAIQDYGRGIIIGDQSTHGKGTVQQLNELGQRIMPVRPPNYGALKLTIQQFYRPGGDSTQNRGVVSDIELPYRTTYLEGIGEADLDYALEFDRVAPLPHVNYPYAGAQLVSTLTQSSERRRQNSEFFIDEMRKIERLKKRQAEATVTLNKDKFLAEREEVNSEKDKEEISDMLQEDDRPIFPLDEKSPLAPYNEEVVAIALDYLKLLKGNQLAVAQ
ncbi:MAG: carboxy terminal-processing peptidase [Planctomycetota bacterium]